MTVSRRRGRPRAGHNAAEFDPASIEGLFVQYDASNADTLGTSGDLVFQWDDAQAGVNNIEQPTEAAQPSTGSSIGSKNAIIFTDKYMTFPTAVGSLVRGSASTIVMVWQTNAPTGSFDQWIWAGNSTSLGTRFNGDSDTMVSYKYMDNDGFPSSLSITPDSAAHTVGQIIDGATQQVYYDGNYGTPNDTSAMSGNALILGAYNAFGGFMDARVGEILIYDRALTTQEMSQIRSYFRSKWGVV